MKVAFLTLLGAAAAPFDRAGVRLGFAIVDGVGAQTATHGRGWGGLLGCALRT